MDSMRKLKSLMNVHAYGLSLVSWEGRVFPLNRRFKDRLGWGKLGDKRGLTIFTFVIIKI